MLFFFGPSKAVSPDEPFPGYGFDFHSSHSLSLFTRCECSGTSVFIDHLCHPTLGSPEFSSYTKKCNSQNSFILFVCFLDSFSSHLYLKGKNGPVSLWIRIGYKFMHSVLKGFWLTDFTMKMVDCYALCTLQRATNAKKRGKGEIWVTPSVAACGLEFMRYAHDGIQETWSWFAFYNIDTSAIRNLPWWGQKAQGRERLALIIL